jgi:phosphoribosylpyrophosphate synthetase
VGGAVERLARLRIRRLVTTDSLALSGEAPFPVTQVSVAALFAGALSSLAAG